MKTLSVVDSGVVGETVFVLLPLPLVLLVSGPILFEESRDLLALSTFRGKVELSPKLRPFEELSETKGKFKFLTKTRTMFINFTVFI